MKILSSFKYGLSRFFKNSANRPLHYSTNKTSQLNFQPKGTPSQDLRELNEFKKQKNIIQIPVSEEEKKRIEEVLIQDINSPNYSAY